MSGMSIFNSRVSESPSNLVCNLDWSGYVRGSDVEKATNKIVGVVEKSTNKIATDAQRSTDKITAAVNNASTSMTPPVAAVVDGLMDMSQATADIAKFLLANPSEMPSAVEAAKGVSKQFGTLTDAASGYDAGTSKLGNEVGEMAKVLDWVDYKFSIPMEAVCVSLSPTAQPVWSGRSAGYPTSINAPGTSALLPPVPRPRLCRIPIPAIHVVCRTESIRRAFGESVGTLYLADKGTDSRATVRLCGKTPVFNQAARLLTLTNPSF